MYERYFVDIFEGDTEESMKSGNKQHSMIECFKYTGIFLKYTEIAFERKLVHQTRGGKVSYIRE